MRHLVCAAAFALGVTAALAGERYFAGQDGKGWVPIGLNICFSRAKVGEAPEQTLDERRAELEGWISALAANGGNYVRLWLGHEFFEVMPEKPGSFDPVRTETLLRVVRLCEKLGIRLKLTLESFRTVYPEGQEPKRLYGSFFNRPLYAPFAKSMADFYRSEECFRIYLEKARYLKSLGLGESPAVWCWELWNEIDATGSPEAYGPWSDRMLAELKRLFPKQLTVQNLGSCAYANSYQAYGQLAGVAGNDFMQMHRYLDPGAPRDVCRGPMDVLAAESIRELLELRGDRPAVLAETGAVKANHTGPSLLYEKDREGTLLHDALFASFFAGGAGCGQFWHWDGYVARWNLWHHYKRFAKAIEGLDPIAEGFRPFRTETARLRVYGLRGRKTTVLWCRDKRSDWQSELVEGKEAETVTGEKLPFWNRTFRCYLPWEDRVVETSAPALPPFRRSIVVRFPTAGQEEPTRPVKVIFDTDMLTDFDDVGALSCLHALADAGECEILATVSCTRGNASVAAIEIINGYYGRGDIPVGCTKGAGVVGDVGSRDGHKATAEEIAATMKRGKEKGDGGHYKYRKLAADYPHWVRHADSDDAPDAVEVYRRVLAAQPDKSVVICSVGFLTNLRLLLQSKGDAHSPLDGRELVARKVKTWVAMCCKYMRGKEYNSMMDPESSRVALSEWPTKVVISDFEFGVDTYAGRAIAEMPGPRNPVKDVFAGSIPTRERVGADPVKWHFMWFGRDGRAAWDETAVLAAVRGETSYFNVRRGEYRMVGEDGEDVWVPDEENGRHLRLTEKVSKLELGRIIDELICRGPKLPVPVALTFDDGCRGQLSVAEPMLAARGWKGTFNIVTGWKSGVMSWDEIRELKRRGHEITSHSVTHPRMVTLLEEGKTNEVVHELRESVATIERETGAKPRWFCAPYVQQNAELDRLARQEGMRVMTVPRIPFGGKHPPDKDYGKCIDAQLAKKPKALDFLIHGITVATGGWGPFFDEKDFSDFLDAIAERERRGLIRVVSYAEAYEANERKELK